MTKLSPSLVKLAEPVLGKPVRITIWKNGEFAGVGEEISISPKALRSWNSILVYLTKYLAPVGAIRKLYFLDTKKPVWCFDELVPGGKYVAAGFEKLKFEENAYQTVSRRRYSKLQAVNFTSKSQAMKATLDTISYTQKKKRTIIYIMVNGKACENPCKIVFIDEDLLDWESVLQYMGHRLNVPEGIQYLCTVTGEIVFEPHQLCHGDLYIGVPFSTKFKKLDYVKMFHELIKNKKEKISYTPRKKGKSKKNTYAPWNTKNRKAPRISATILGPTPVNENKTSASSRSNSRGKTSASSRSNSHGKTSASSRSNSRGNTSNTVVDTSRPNSNGGKTERSLTQNPGPTERSLTQNTGPTERSLTQNTKTKSGNEIFQAYAVYSVTCKNPKCTNKTCLGSCEKKSVNISEADTLKSSGSQTLQERKTNAIKHKLGSVINACLDAVENYGFIEPQKTQEYHRARESIQDRIKKISAKQVENDYDGEETGTQLITFAQIAQRNISPQTFDPADQSQLDSETKYKAVQLNSEKRENPFNNITERKQISLRGDLENGQIRAVSQKSVDFEEKALSVDSSTNSEIELSHAYSKKSLTEQDIVELRESQAARGSKVPEKDSFDLYKHIWHNTLSHSGLYKVPLIESNVNFVNGSSNEMANHGKIKRVKNNNKVNKQPSCCNGLEVPPLSNLTEINAPYCCETILSTSDADVDELWKKSSTQSVEKSIDERPNSSENGSETSRTTDTYAEHDSTVRNSSKTKSGSAPAINCCTSSKLEAVINRVKRRNRLEYVSSDEDPFVASERRARGKNVLINKDAAFFGQLGSVVIRNGQNFAEEYIETPPTEGSTSKSSVKKKDTNLLTNDETIIDKLVKITSDTLQNPVVNTLVQCTGCIDNSLSHDNSLKVSTQTSFNSKSQSVQIPVNSSNFNETSFKENPLASSNSLNPNSSGIRMVSLDNEKNKNQPLDPITSCSEQSDRSKPETSKEQVKTLYSDVSATPSDIEANKKVFSKSFRQKCISFACSEICLQKPKGCEQCKCAQADKSNHDNND